MLDNNKLVNWLFETGAVRICPEDKPFWYTSGTIGPYYINTHFLYGSEQKALKLLETIDACKNDILACPEKILSEVEKNYQSDVIYKGLIDSMIEFVRSSIKLEEIDYISGGERRDWFFSLIIAKLLKKPHITIYKDMTAVITENGKTVEAENIMGAKVLHIADLITEASSYERAWIPAIKSIGGQMTNSLVVIDRLQGGSELLASKNVCSFAMISIEKEFFDNALKMGLITQGQHYMLIKYIADPKEAMKAFIKSHPEFIDNSLKADPKTAERARLCLEKGIYD